MISAHLRKSSFTKKAASLLCEPYVSLSSSFHFLSTLAPRVSSEQPHTKIPKNSESTAIYLKDLGFSDSQLENVFKKREQLLFADVEKTIKPKISMFQEFGFSRSEIAIIINKDPAVLCSSLTNKVYPSLSLLRDLLGSTSEITRVLRRTRGFLTTDLRKTVFSNIEFLKNNGAPMQRILLLLRSFPSSLYVKPQVFRKHLENLESLGVNSSSKMYIYCIWAIASQTKEVWELKLEAFRDSGFTESEALIIFRRAPQVFSVSPEKIRRITEAILATKKYKLSSIMAHPVSLCCSLENRLKPRLQVLDNLEKMELINKWPSLGVVYAYNDERFYGQFTALIPSEITYPGTRTKNKE